MQLITSPKSASDGLVPSAFSVISMVYLVATGSHPSRGLKARSVVHLFVAFEGCYLLFSLLCTVHTVDSVIQVLSLWELLTLVFIVSGTTSRLPSRQQRECGSRCVLPVQCSHRGQDPDTWSSP